MVKTTQIERYILFLFMAWIIGPLAFGQARAAQFQAGCAQTIPSPTPTYKSFFGRQAPVGGQSAGWRIDLVKREKYPPCIYGTAFLFREVKKPGGAASEFRLCTEAAQIDEVDIIGESRALILGRLGASFSVADVVDLVSGKILDHFTCFMPVLSPGHGFLAFLKSFPGHPGPMSVSDEYLVYDLTRDAKYNRPHFRPGMTYDAGWPIYPPGATNAPGDNLVPGLSSPIHMLSSSRLFWVSNNTLAFTDYFQGEDRIVVAGLTRGVTNPNVVTLKLDPEKLVDLNRCQKYSAQSDFARWSKQPAGLIRVNQIQILKARPDLVCLRFVSNPCLRYNDVTVKLP